MNKSDRFINRLQKALEQSSKYQEEFSAMTNKELAYEVLEMWADIDLWSRESSLLEEVRERLLSCV